MLFFLFVRLKDVKTPSQVKMCMDSSGFTGSLLVSPDRRLVLVLLSLGRGVTMVETFHLPKCPNNMPNVSDWPSWSKTNQSDEIKGSYRSCLQMCHLTSAALMAKRPLNAR